MWLSFCIQWQLKHVLVDWYTFDSRDSGIWRKLQSSVGFENSGRLEGSVGFESSGLLASPGARMGSKARSGSKSSEELTRDHRTGRRGFKIYIFNRPNYSF